MATYAIGDIQGCLEPFLRLLETIEFDQTDDHLWLAGDLVNRGPDSLGVLRLAYQLKEHCTIVLGNHDLHLLAHACGLGKSHPSDTLGGIIKAPDGPELLHWLRHQRLFYHDSSIGFSLVHAGLHPHWSINDALRLSQEVETQLQSEYYTVFLAEMYGNQPDQWSEELTGTARLRVITNYLTRLRYCTADGTMNFSHKQRLAPANHQPWFAHTSRNSQNQPIVFGHWAALCGETVEPHIHALDTGCVWGQSLTALRLDDLKRFSTNC